MREERLAVEQNITNTTYLSPVPRPGPLAANRGSQKNWEQSISVLPSAPFYKGKPESGEDVVMSAVS